MIRLLFAAAVALFVLSLPIHSTKPRVRQDETKALDRPLEPALEVVTAGSRLGPYEIVASSGFSSRRIADR